MNTTYEVKYINAHAVSQVNIDIFGLYNILTNNMREAINAVHFRFLLLGSCCPIFSFIVFCRSLVVFCPFFFAIVLSVVIFTASDCPFGIIKLLALVLSVLRFTDFNYPFGIIKHFYSCSCSISDTRRVTIQRHEHLKWKSCWTPVCVNKYKWH